MATTLTSALAHGHVHVLDADEEAHLAPIGADGTAPTVSMQWTIRDAEGNTLDTVAGPRSSAIRRMGVVAYQGASLPLVLFGADGRPTGDRLPG